MIKTKWLKNVVLAVTIESMTNITDYMLLVKNALLYGVPNITNKIEKKY